MSGRADSISASLIYSPNSCLSSVSALPQVTAGLKEVRDRITSVKNTQKITDAMKLVAAAKVRRAQDAVVNGRPFAENLVKVSPLCCFCRSRAVAEHTTAASSILECWRKGTGGDRRCCTASTSASGLRMLTLPWLTCAP